MTKERGPSAKKSIALTLAGLFVFIFYLYFFVGFSEILDVLGRVNIANYLLYYSLAFAAAFLSMLFYSLTWWELLKLLSVKISFRNAFVYSWLGIFVDLVVPFEAVTGEITRVYLATRNSTGHVGRIIASVVSHRILSTMVVLASSVISSASIAFKSRVLEYVWNLLVIVEISSAAFILLIIYFSVRREASEKIADSFLRFVNFVSKGRLKLEDLRTRAFHALSSFYQGIQVIRSRPKGLIKPAVFNLAAWLSHLAIYILVFHALDFKIPLDVSIIVYSISVSVQTIPIGLSVGLVEIVMASLYGIFGIPLAVSGTAAALIRIVTFWFEIIVGYAIAQWIGIKALTQMKIKEI